MLRGFLQNELTLQEVQIFEDQVVLTFIHIILHLILILNIEGLFFFIFLKIFYLLLYFAQEYIYHLVKFNIYFAKNANGYYKPI